MVGALGAACADHPRSPPPPRISPALTPADVGLPDTPDPDTPDEVLPPLPPIAVSADPGTPVVYRREECPPGPYGCVTSRVVTSDDVKTLVTCPRSLGHSSYRSLRSISIRTLHVDEGGGLDRVQIRRALVVYKSLIKRCLDLTGVPAHVELRGIVRPHGGVMVVDIIGAADRSRTCLHDVMAAMHFASSRSNTKFGCELDYSVEDPNAQPPLQCP